jgi:hypothetical protein
MSTTLLAPIAFAAMLAWGSSSHAAPPGLGPVECADIRGTLTATPSSIDRETSTSLQTLLQWSVDVPKRYPFPPIVTLERRTLSLERHTVRLSGTKAFTAIRETIFVLRAGDRDLARATVTVNGDPGFIGFSPGRQVTPYEIAKFNQQWMQPFPKLAALAFAESTLSKLDTSGATATGEWMAAMVRMFDLTQDPRYLDHLRDFIQLALNFRDDRPLDSGPNVIRPTDQIRNKVGLPAWGGGMLDTYGLHSVDELVSSLYAYPIAAFARILAENPPLRARYACLPVRQLPPPRQQKGAAASLPGPCMLANRIIETVGVFLPQIRHQRDINEAYLAHPDEYRNRPTQADCDNAFNDAKKQEPRSLDRWKQLNINCNAKRQFAGKAMPHNINLTFSMVLIELSRVLDSPFYLQSPKRMSGVEGARDSFLILISRQQLYFVHHLNPGGLKEYDACKRNFCWYYMDSRAPGHDPHPEDTDHGSMDMSYVGLFARDSTRLHAAEERLHESLSLGPEQLRGFARTFVETIAAGHDFKHDVAGHEEKSPPDSNTRCEGWLELTRADLKVWQACRDMSLRIIDEQQPYLGVGNHSALLWSKQFLPR